MINNTTIQPRCILLVDDDGSWLDATRRLLHQYNPQWQVTTLTSAGDAHSWLTANHCDTIVCDYHMPAMTGLDLLKKLNESEILSLTPFIMVTGRHEQEIKRLAISLGATDLLSKPVVFEDLIARLQHSLHLRDCQERLSQLNASLEEKVKERTLDLERSREDVIWRLAKAGENRDDHTGLHIARVSVFSGIVATAMQLEREFIDLLKLTAPLHDIGKIGVPDHILLKPGSLNPEERAVIEMHCEIGADILSRESVGQVLLGYDICEYLDTGAVRSRLNNPLLDCAATIALTHHEKWDGTGYPGGLKGEEIPLQSRILAFADVYDALRSQRPYKGEFDAEKTWSILRKNIGTHFDPDVFDAAQRVRREIDDTYYKYRSPIEQEQYDYSMNWALGPQTIGE